MNFLKPIKKDLIIENLFTNELECHNLSVMRVRLLSPYYEHYLLVNDTLLVTAHGALRLSFHDTIGTSPTLG